MPAWYILTNFWLHHDLLFTHFGAVHAFAEYNRDRFPRVAVRFHEWRVLFEWCNLNG